MGNSHDRVAKSGTNATECVSRTGRLVTATDGLTPWGEWAQQARILGRGTVDDSPEQPDQPGGGRGVQWCESERPEGGVPVPSEAGPSRSPGMMMCPNCRGRGQVHSPALAVFDGEAQTAVAPRQCRQCRESGVPGWLPELFPPG